MDEKRREKSAEKKRREGKSCGEGRKVIEGGGGWDNALPISR